MLVATRNLRGGWWAAFLLMLLVLMFHLPMTAAEASLEELKDRVANASIQDRPPLCIQISERQMEAFSRFYAAGDNDKAQAALVDVTAFTGLARDYAIQSHKHEKQSEIAIRKISRKLSNLKHTVTHEDQKQIQDAIDRLEQIRDDLLTSMFPHGVRK
jgi:hypothetical protein